MQARMTHPAFLVPEALKGLQAYSKSANGLGVPAVTLELVYLRAGQINGCGVCVELHSNELKKAGEPDERIWSVGAWRDSPYFSEEERAALALTEAVTRIADSSDPVPDEVWAQATKHYDEQGMSALLIAISAINTWNRLNVATRQVVGEWKP
jgi:AhpD family alkylhydroperoxidase